ncbi:MAG TPA: Hsp20/alpha crystallin family protein [Anaerolineaceae bacterium]
MLYRRMRFPNVWEEMNQMQREMERLASAFAPYRRSGYPVAFPAVNVWTSEQGHVLTAELPGMNPDDIHIDVTGDTLTLSGERKPEDLKEGAEYHRQERGYGKFSRTIQLDFPVEVSKVEAKLEKGVLTVSLPRAEADKPKKIVVKAS